MTQKDTQKQPQAQSNKKKPNENGVINVEGFVKIFDPKSKEVYVEKRA
jgi:hypothetical protein